MDKNQKHQTSNRETNFDRPKIIILKKNRGQRKVKHQNIFLGSRLQSEVEPTERECHVASYINFCI